MKKKLLLISMVAAVIALGVSGAWAYSYDFPFGYTGGGQAYTQVEEYYGDSTHTATPYPPAPIWSNIIANSGDTSFNIVGANLVNGASGWQLDIYTGWPGGTGKDVVSSQAAFAADLTLTSGGTTWMVRMYGANGSSTLGQVFSGTGTGWYQTSNTYTQANTTAPGGGSSPYWPDDGSFIYGGKYAPYNDHSLANDVPVWATSGYTGNKTTLTWTDLGKTVNGTTYTYDVWEAAVNLSGISGFDVSKGFSFIYATGNCANSVLTGTEPTGAVPLPPSALLLGSGLLGLVGLGWRRGRAG